MRWTAHFADGAILQRDLQIYAAIQPRLSELVKLTLEYGPAIAEVDFGSGAVSINGQVIIMVPLAHLHDIRPICFRRLSAEISTSDSRRNITCSFGGIGVQGLTSRQQNMQAWLSIDHDGRWELHEKGVKRALWQPKRQRIVLVGSQGTSR